MQKNLDWKNKKYIGPLMVCLGALFWATDFPVRANLVSIFGNGSIDGAIQLGMFEHLLALFIFIFILVGYSIFNSNKEKKIDYKKYLELNKLEIFSLLWIGICSSALGIVFFNLAFGQAAILQSAGIYSGYDQALFTQKVQPIIAVIFAAWLLKERIPKRFIVFVGIAIVGFMLLTFGTNSWPFISFSLSNPSFLLIEYAFIAAFFWGTGTVFGRILVKKLGHTLTTFSRYAVGGIFLIFLNLSIGTNFSVALGTALSGFWPLLYAALVSGGLVGLYIYYYGLKWTKASIATFCELTYPIAAVIFNYFFLNVTMYSGQWVGAIIIVITITVMTYKNNSIEEEQIFDDSYLNPKKVATV